MAMPQVISAILRQPAYTGQAAAAETVVQKRQMVLGQLAAHGVADTCTEEREYHLEPRRRRVEM